jgi:hypothetical protein
LFEKSQGNLNNVCAEKAEQQVVYIVTAKTEIVKGAVSVPEHTSALEWQVVTAQHIKTVVGGNEDGLTQGPD